MSTLTSTALKEYRIGVIGCGMRAISFFKNLPDAFRGRVHLGAVYDPDPAYAAHYLRSCGMSGERNGEIPFVDSDSAVLNTPDLDGLIIGSPNHTHVSIATRAFARRLPILLEKPVSISYEECRTLWQSWTAAGCPPVRVGFVLRDTPFYRTLRQALDEQLVGQILSIDSDELIGDMTTAFFWKSWRLDERKSGGFLLEKCCHDFDLLRNLSGGEAVRIHAVSRKTHLTPDTPPAQRHERFDNALRRHRIMDGEVEPKAESFYDIATPSHDHYAVTIEWDNGVLSQFTCCLAQARHARRVRIYGSDGGLTGDMHDNTLILDKPGSSNPDHSGPDTRALEVPEAIGNHHGGDRFINETFWGMVAGGGNDFGAGIRDGIEAALLSLAAQESIATQAPVDVTRLRHYVFQSTNPKPH